MGIIKCPDSDCWYIEFIYNGRRHKASSGTTDKTKACAVEAKMRAELLAGNDPSSLPKIALAQAISRYIGAVIQPKNNPKVLSADSYLRRNFARAVSMVMPTGGEIGVLSTRVG